ncbi:DUF3493 domain-containing protein [Leptolyngbya sp. FACHB-261]|uniref:DUF3493 domain-containing protein n=1 Tax=Leptolyngbya sp. FACHB-261 TaxID=2692806 RepID=UPI001689C82A|nr:DUF3493 domain-containing protein [Leptolyngbya sp. FACHB-261]MBD2100501.1 DUF3493 domain-containing protein [Leptolyngbya sp. FACHB-261]
MADLSPEDRTRLRAEVAAPYRGLRKLVYGACAASGLIGALVFGVKLLAGRELESSLPSFALQTGVVALMIWLFRLEQRADARLQERMRKREAKR